MNAEDSLKEAPEVREKKENNVTYRLRKIPVFLLIVTLATIITLRTGWPTLEDHVLHLSLAEVLGPAASFAEQEPWEIKALLVDYSGHEELLLKARVALLKYPEMSRQVFLWFGDFSVFQEVLLQYGEPVIPVIHYFLHHESLGMKISEPVRGAKEFFLKLFRHRDKPLTENNAAVSLKPEERRGLYAIAWIKEEGHHFLGQFVVTKDQEVKWLLTDRTLQNIGSLFFGGLRNLEARWAAEQQLTGGDFLSAGLDVVLMGGAFKLLKQAKNLKNVAKAGSLSRRISLFGRGVLPRGERLWALLKYGSVITAGYVVVKHPSVLSGIFGEGGRLLGAPPFLFQVLCWSLLFLLLLWPLRGLLKLLLPLARGTARLFVRRVEMRAA